MQFYLLAVINGYAVDFESIFLLNCVKRKITLPAGSAKIYFVGKIQFAYLYGGAVGQCLL